MKQITQQEIIELSLFRKHTNQLETRLSQLLNQDCPVEQGALNLVRTESGLEVVAS